MYFCIREFMLKRDRGTGREDSAKFSLSESTGNKYLNSNHMKKFLTRSLLLILFITGGIGNAFADYWEAGSYNGPFQFTRTVLSLDTTWIGWRFANYNYDGIDDELRYSRWYVGGNKAGWETYRTKPSEYFYTPFWQGKEILYLERGHGITQRQNEEYGVGDITAEKNVDDIISHEMIFYPGELMGPEEMKYFYIRVTGFWDIDSDDGDGHWMGQGESSLGNAADGATWQGPGVRHRGNGVARYAQVT